MIKSFLTTTIFLTLLGFSSNAQLDSVSLTANFGYESVEDFEGSIVQQKMITSETWINDFDFFGEIIVTVYDQEANYPVDKQKFSKQQITDLNMINDGVISIKTYTIEENRSYRIEAIVTNYQGLYMPVLESILSAN